MASKAVSVFYGVGMNEPPAFVSKFMKSVVDKCTEFSGIVIEKGSPKEMVDLTSLSWHELRALAKEKNIDGYTKMKRSELEEALDGIISDAN